MSLPHYGDVPKIRLSRDGTALTMSWKVMGILIGAAIAATSAWLNLKFDVSTIKNDVAEMKAEVRSLSEQNRAKGAIIARADPKN